MCLGGVYTCVPFPNQNLICYFGMYITEIDHTTFLVQFGNILHLECLFKKFRIAFALRAHANRTLFEKPTSASYFQIELEVVSKLSHTSFAQVSTNNLK